MRLLNLFVHGVLVAVRAEFLQFDAAGGVTTIFLRRVSRYPIRPLIVVGATLSALKSNY